jgi:glycosyltransferase involved in cell wall biosynthesis
LHIGIDGLHLFGQYGGVQYALTRLLAALRTQYPDDTVTLFAPRDFKGLPDVPESDRFHVRRTWFPGRWRSIRTLWRDLRLQKCCYRQSCDLLHGATYSLPPVLSLPSVVTIHDVIALTHPLFCTPGSARVQRIVLPRSAKSARRIIVPTEAVRHEVERLLKIEPYRIDVAPWGVGPEFRPVEDRGLLDEARRRWQLPERFALFVGTLEPKKNIEGLLRAFVAARLNRNLPHGLVLAGRTGWGVSHLARDIRGHDADGYVRLLSYVPEPALPLLYSMADALVLPSHVEGFGMPVLEAMACGCPVITSKAPALLEVGGNATRVCNTFADKPYQELREGLEEVLLDEGGIRAKLRERGLKRAAKFTWQRTAELTRASYQKAMQ